MDEFWRDPRYPDGLRRSCKECMAARSRAWHIANREHVNRRHRERHWETRDRKLAQRYGLTEEELRAMRQSQEDRCAACSTELTHQNDAIDHCHKTGRVRGVLCRRCNAALGLLKESPERIRGLLSYIEAAA